MEGSPVGSGVGSGDGSGVGSVGATTVTFSVTESSLPSRLILMFAIPSVLAVICPSGETEATGSLSLSYARVPSPFRREAPTEATLPASRVISVLDNSMEGFSLTSTLQAAFTLSSGEAT